MNNADLDESTKNNKKIERVNTFGIFYNRKILLSGVLIYGGIGFPILINSQGSVAVFFRENTYTMIGIVLALIGVALAMAEIEKVKLSRREERFIDVDEEKNLYGSNFINEIVRDVNSLKAKSVDINPQSIENLVKDLIEAKLVEKSNMFDSFENYFNEIRRVLLEQAHALDKKASMLLDKGTAYSKNGIIFFVVSIILWQIVAGVTGFQNQYIYGIVSCSLLFIFIEFLSAWFLKQYRHFVDTSTYHIKVKSIFDKYMMSYLAIKSLSGNDDEQYKAMLKILEQDIKWPETYFTNSADVSFAKDAIESMIELAKALKSEAKN